jgi:hypothetical protein
MEDQDGGHRDLNGDAMSPESSKTKLQLPMSCDPPGLANPPKQLVWIVSTAFISPVATRHYLHYFRTLILPEA